MASLRKSDRLISSRDYRCFTISPPQLPAAATRFPSHGSGRPKLELRTAKLSSVGFEPTAVLTFDLRVRRLNHSATRSLLCFSNYQMHYLKMTTSLSLASTNNHVSWNMSAVSCLACALLNIHRALNLKFQLPSDSVKIAEDSA